ncbi:histone acetyltransferase KAT7 [Achroia grisella]|uniref:histone acetyltransferase KAT7 n=1 Tax=Achroia grisella TaxID=688607 RepID=UPI0027D234A4|nr:histone acetyltransferase KAT7 [Achroia grisella]
MTNLVVSNSSTDSSSGSSSDSSSSVSSSSSSGSGSTSSDSESSTSDTPAVTTAAVPKSPPKPAPEEPKAKEEPKPRRPSKVKISSSSDDDAPKTDSPKSMPPRRRCSAKPKAAIAVLAKGKPSPRLPTGAKTPKPIPKTMTKPSKSDSTLKKKSIFSPDNSSESESESKSSKSPKGSPKSKRGSRKSLDEKDTPPLTPAENEDSNPKDNVKRRNSNRPNGPPPKKVVEEKSTSSCSSSPSSVESVSSDSNSEPTPKKDPPKTGKTKPPSNTNKQETTGKSGDSGESATSTMPRKLTRSLSARVSRLATVSRPTHTDTDSDVDEKTNGKGKESKKPPPKGRPVPRSPAAGAEAAAVAAVPTERRCPVGGCDSSGHLGGAAARHFTWDACPRYHRASPAACRAAAEERAAAAAARRRAADLLLQRPRAQPTIDQRAYQLKVKDMRSKWKGSQELREKLAAAGNEESTEEREPILEGFAPDYDLRLFREAQALAAIKIEEELGDIPSDRGTRYVVMGKYMMEVWYQSPYPGEAARVARLFVCEFCLGHHRCAAGAARHRAKCVWRHPPGDEVYRKDNLSVWQVDGRKHKQYCQHLCLLAKFFLDHKTLYYDVEPFLFYVMTCADNEGCHIVGYFSKEKNSFLNYNVSCILTLPPYQRQGYGRLLIDFSYLLTKVEGKVGSPETPLSDLGLISYRSYWKEALLRRLCSASGATLCIRDLSKDLAIASSDIVSTLQERGLMKYWKGKHIVLKKQEVLEEVSRRAERARCVDAECLRWAPPAAAAPPR